MIDIVKNIIKIVGILLFIRFLIFYLPIRTPLDISISDDFVNVDGDIMTGNLTVPRLFISEKIYKHIIFPANIIKIHGASNIPSWEIFRGTTISMAFSGTTIEQAFVTSMLPHTYIGNSNVYPHFHFTPSTNNSGNLSSVWCIEYTWANEANGTFPSTVTKCIDVRIHSISHTHQITNVINISGINKSESSILNIRIFRDPTNASDNYTSDLYLIGFGIHYQINRLGDEFNEILP